MTTQKDDAPLDTFELRLAIARHVAGRLSAAEAALLVGVSGQTWRNWESGTSPGGKTDAMLAHIANRLGVPEKWLREGGPLTSAPPLGGLPEGRPTLGSVAARLLTRRYAPRLRIAYLPDAA